MNRQPQPDGIAVVDLPHTFTLEERNGLSSMQNAALTEIGRLDAELAEIAKGFQQKVGAQRSIVEATRKLLVKGSELRPVEVIVEFNPTAGTKRYFAADDALKHHLLAEVPMTKKDYELPLPLFAAPDLGSVGIIPTAKQSGVNVTKDCGSLALRPRPDTSPVPVLAQAVTERDKVIAHPDAGQAVPVAQQGIAASNQAALSRCQTSTQPVAAGDSLKQQAIEVIRSEQKATPSLIQRRLRLSYAQAFAIIEELESDGVVGPEEGCMGLRKILKLPPV
jgi:DNA segregation ATPase FtsK/SpoIIIE-like protein